MSFDHVQRMPIAGVGQIRPVLRPARSQAPFQVFERFPSRPAGPSHRRYTPPPGASKPNGMIAAVREHASHRRDRSRRRAGVRRDRSVRGVGGKRPYRLGSGDDRLRHGDRDRSLAQASGDRHARALVHCRVRGTGAVVGLLACLVDRPVGDDNRGATLADGHVGGRLLCGRLVGMGRTTRGCRCRCGSDHDLRVRGADAIAAVTAWLTRHDRRQPLGSAGRVLECTGLAGNDRADPERGARGGRRSPRATGVCAGRDPARLGPVSDLQPRRAARAGGWSRTRGRPRSFTRPQLAGCIGAGARRGHPGGDRAAISRPHQRLSPARRPGASGRCRAGPDSGVDGDLRTGGDALAADPAPSRRGHVAAPVDRLWWAPRCSACWPWSSPAASSMCSRPAASHPRTSRAATSTGGCSACPTMGAERSGAWPGTTFGTIR